MKILKTADEISKYREMIAARGTQEDSEVINSVMNILSNIKCNGQGALVEYTKKFDGIELADFKVKSCEIEEAIKRVDQDFIKAIKKSIENISYYHSKQIRNSFVDNSKDGIVLGQKITPLNRVGVYVPGGTATYPSSVIMNVIPAKLAGVEEIIMVSPPNKNGNICDEILVTAYQLGVKEIYKVGGAQAIGALAYGTTMIPKVDKIVGPGNIYVATAKKYVYGVVDIDMIAGPSEILIIADEKANPRFVAADLISQAEHDELASSILITTSEELIDDVLKELDSQILERNRPKIISSSLDNYGAIILQDSMDDAIELSNDIAPEHLEVMLDNPLEKLSKIKNAGSIFLGSYSPEPLGDYMAGPNHVLPTNGTARFFSPLSVDDFIKKSCYMYYSKEALMNIGQDVINFANYEGLDGHGNSIKVRMEE